MRQGDDTKYVYQKYFIAEELAQKKIQEDRVPYDIWQSQGLVEYTEGHRVDYNRVTQWFLDLVQKQNIRPLWIGYDKWNAQYFTEQMQGYGFEMIVVRQGYQSLSTPMKELQADLIEKKVNYNNNPILKWNLSNVAIKADENGNIRPVKNVSDKMRIDGAVSLLIAYSILIEKYQDYRNLT